MESRTDVWICRPLVVGVVDRERVKEANLSEIQYIEIFVSKVGPVFEERRDQF